MNSSACQSVFVLASLVSRTMLDITCSIQCRPSCSSMISFFRPCSVPLAPTTNGNNEDSRRNPGDLERFPEVKSGTLNEHATGDCVRIEIVSGRVSS
ncbi:hypothetical protein FB446DRAFT_716482 [Lentinula raphanica]|nr:hypothetical protein FB446DRAFT_716482 [Lentinula raphanica]